MSQWKPIKGSETFYYGEFNDNGKRKRKVAWSYSPTGWPRAYHTVENGWKPVTITTAEVTHDYKHIGYIIIAVEENKRNFKRAVVYNEGIMAFKPVKWEDREW